MGPLQWGEFGKSNQKVKGLNPAVQAVDYFHILTNQRFRIKSIFYPAISYRSYAMVDFIVTYGTVELQTPYWIASLLITVISLNGVLGGFYSWGSPIIS